MEDFDELFGAETGRFTPENPHITPAEEIPTAFKPTGIDLTLDNEVIHIEPNEPLWKFGLDVNNAREAEAQARINTRVVREQKAEIQKKIQALREEFDAKMIALNEELQPFTSAVYTADRDARMAAYATKDAEQKLRDAMVALANRQKFLQESVKFDQITASLFWREWALEHQLEGAKFLATAKRGILADKMGLGKTLTALIWADMLKVQKLLVIVPDDVATNFVHEIAHWAPHRHAILVGKRNKDQRDMIFNILLPALSEYTVVVNYSAWRKDKTVIEKLIDCRFEAVIMDEAHTIKNIRTSAFKGCRDIALAENACPECNGRIQPVHDGSDMEWGEIRDYMLCAGENKVSSKRLDLYPALEALGCGWSEARDQVRNVKREFGAKRSVKYLVTMTGTPILNKPTDIFAMLNLVDSVTYSSEPDFIRNYCQKNPYTSKIEFRSGGMESLIKRLSGIYIGRDRKSAGVVLPKQEIVVHSVEFNKQKYQDQARVIKQLSEHAALILGSGKVLPIPALIALITRKRQANVWPAGITIKDPETGLVIFSVSDDVDESQKLDFIIERPETSESGEWEGLGWDITGEGDRVNGERLVIFSQFKTPLAELEKRFKRAGVDVVRFDGDTPNEIRELAKVDFDRARQVEGQDYRWQVILCNYKTGGVGLNFTDCTQTIVLDEEWNPGKRDQAYARTDRIGQTEESTVHVIRQENSIDEWLAALIEDKENMINDFESGASMQQAFADFLKNEEF